MTLNDDKIVIKCLFRALMYKFLEGQVLEHFLMREHIKFIFKVFQILSRCLPILTDIIQILSLLMPIIAADVPHIGGV